MFIFDPFWQWVLDVQVCNGQALEFTNWAIRFFLKKSWKYHTGTCLTYEMWARLAYIEQKSNHQLFIIFILLSSCFEITQFAMKTWDDSLFVKNCRKLLLVIFRKFIIATTLCAIWKSTAILPRYENNFGISLC